MRKGKRRRGSMCDAGRNIDKKCRMGKEGEELTSLQWVTRLNGEVGKGRRKG